MQGELPLKNSFAGRQPFIAVLAAAAVVLVTACAKAPVVAPPPAPVTVVVEAGAGPDANPDRDGRASPVVLRVYQLADDAAFGKAEFFALWDREQETLAAASVGRHELTLAPGGRGEARFTLDPRVRSIGVAAALRDFRGVSWKTSVAVPEQAAPGSTLRLVVDVDSRAVAARWQ